MSKFFRRISAFPLKHFQKPAMEIFSKTLEIVNMKAFCRYHVHQAIWLVEFVKINLA